MGFKVEVFDEDGVWCVCIVVEISNDEVIVLFDGWNVEWNCSICDLCEIRD